MSFSRLVVWLACQVNSGIATGWCTMSLIWSAFNSAASAMRVGRFVHQAYRRRRTTMVSAIVLLSTERDKIKQVAEQLTDLPGISEVFSVAGNYDLVAILRVPDNEALADLVTDKMLKVDGIVDSETLIAFKVYSRHDLEAMFSIGFEA
jgi:DNA-binding Lrp family transcriptional regulator